MRRNGRIEKLSCKTTVRLEPGDTLIVRTPGGGGYGDPRERDREKVIEDVLNGYVSRETAAKVYGVMCCEYTSTLDES